jgi:arsenical pump membrane protein
MNNMEPLLLITIFTITVLFIMWRPFGLNVSVPASAAAFIVLLFGFVPLAHISGVFKIVGGPSITVLSTIVISIALESIGFFRWTAINLAMKAKGSGRLLFWYINLLCFLMTIFFNNDGSILITTPIIIHVLSLLRLKTREQIPYLISGALVATAASAPVGVSNLANLAALEIVGLDLNSYTAIMFVPSLLGILCIALSLYFYFSRDIPRSINIDPISDTNKHLYEYPLRKLPHPLAPKPEGQAPIDWKWFRFCTVVVIATRISLFALAPLGVPTEWPAVAGAVSLILISWHKRKTGMYELLRKSPWHILLFAFSMVVIVYGLHNAGMTALIAEQFGDSVAAGSFRSIFIMGLLLTVLSNICSNLPSIMIGTISITEMGLNLQSMQAAYLANVIGADIGALLLPIGTLPILLWMHMLKQHKISMSWGTYLKVTIVVIPGGLILSLMGLYLWTTYFAF